MVQVPDAHALGGTGGGEEGALRIEGDGLHGARRVERQRLGAGGTVPQADSTTEAGGGERMPVGRERDTADRLRIGPEAERLAGGVWVPDAQDAVAAGGGNLAVTTDGDVEDAVVKPMTAIADLAGVEVPEEHLA